MTIKNIPFFRVVVVLVVGTLLYFPVFSYDLVKTDDDTLIEQDKDFLGDIRNYPSTFSRPFMAADTSVGKMPYYRPLIIQSLMIDSILFNFQPSGYHRTNLLVHLLVGVLFLYLLGKLGFGYWSALIGALIFVVHPAATHAVAWIPGRVDVLLTFFLLLSSIFYLHYMRTPERKRFLLGHIIFFYAALGCKESAALLPVILLAVILYQHPIRTWRNLLYRHSGLLMGWGVAGFLWLFGWFGTYGGTSIAKLLTSGAGSPVQLSVLLVNFGKLFLPLDMAVLATLKDSNLWEGVMALICLALLLRVPINRKKLGYGGLLWILLLSLPSIMYAHEHILEDRLYELLPGLIVCLLLIGEWVFDQEDRLNQVLAASLSLCILLFYMYQTVNYLPAFQNQRTFLTNAVQTSPSSALANLNYGNFMFQEQQYDQAELHYKNALAMEPNRPFIRNGLGVLYKLTNRPQEAEQYFKLEIELNPFYQKAYLHLAELLVTQQRTDEARNLLEEAVKRIPNSKYIIGKLMVLYDQDGDHEKALRMQERLQSMGYTFFLNK